MPSGTPVDGEGPREVRREARGATRIALADDAKLGPLAEVLGFVPGPVAPAGEPSPPANGIRLLTADPWDVPALVERAVVDGGVVAHHILAEVGADVAQLLDLGLGRTRLVLVTPTSQPRLPATRRPRVVTTHPRSTRRYFGRRGEQVEIVALRTAHDAIAALGAADAAVVPLDDDGTAADGLVVADVLGVGAARFVVGRSARLVRAAEIGAVLGRLEAALRRLADGKVTDAAP